MIIWRGWGILAILVTAAGMAGAILPMEALMGRGETASTLGPGIGLLISGVANFFIGRWLNLTRPAQ